MLTIPLVIGVQHFLLAKILLAIFDPKLPRIGGNRTVAVRSMEVHISPTHLPKVSEYAYIG
jgi:hypothetical protein